MDRWRRGRVYYRDMGERRATAAGKRSSNVVSAIAARKQFAQILRRAAHQHERFLVDRGGNPEVIIMGVKDYINTIAPPPDALRALWAESKQKGLDKMSMREIDAAIAKYRLGKRRKPTARQPKRRVG